MLEYHTHANPISIAAIFESIDDDYNATFNIGVDFDDLVAMWGVDVLNDYLDDCVESGNGHLLEDVVYRLAGTDAEMVIIEVTANTRYLENQLEEE